MALLVEVMSYHKQLVRCFCILLLLQTIPSCSHSKPYQCIDLGRTDTSDTFSASLDTLDTYQILTDGGILRGVTWPELLDMPDAQGLLYVPYYVQLRIDPVDAGASQASFAVSFSMSVYQTPKNQTTTEGRKRSTTSGLAFLILPAWAILDNTSEDASLLKQLALGAGGSLAPSNTTPWIAPIAGGGDVSVEIGTLGDGSIGNPYGPLLQVNVTFIERVAASYTVWVDYNSSGHRLSVYISAGAGEGNPKPENAIAVLEHVSFLLSNKAYFDAYFGFFASVGQLLRLRTWNSTVQCLPRHYTSIHYSPSTKDKIGTGVLVVEVVVVVIVIVSMAICCWCQERRLKNKEDEFAKAMQCLPGMPTQVDFADIMKATNNFHETTRLGRGGFGAVYRCTLPAAASRTGQPMEVAVKRFTRGLRDRRLGDFFAEVSIINRLSQRNIVPLLGWSYLNGEPLLIYEYMANSSLDQHLFRRRQPEDTAIRQWVTRYGIVRDITMGLHYIHHEHQPMVLHRDIKASNIMLDSNFCARLGDFGISCTVAANRNSITGFGGSWGYIAPECPHNIKATRQTDIYAFGVLVLEVVTGKKWDFQFHPDGVHITDWVWRLHREGKLLDAVDVVVFTAGGHQLLEAEDEAKRLLLLGLACTNPNPLDRPSMVEVAHVVTKLAAPPDVPLERPTFVWPPEGWRSLNSVCSIAGSDLDGRSSADMVELMPFGEEHLGFSGSRHASVSVYHTTTSGSPDGIGTGARPPEKLASEQNVAAARASAN